MKKILLGILMCVVLPLSSCDKYLDINKDPVNPQIAQSYVILPSMYANMARAVQWDGRYIGQYIQNWGTNTGGNVWEAHGYQFTALDPFSEHFRAHYFGIGRNIDLIIADGEQTGQYNYVGVAKAIRAWSWQASTDLYGPMILKQAFKENQFVFDYDSQEEVYAEVLKLSNEAIEALQRTDGTGTPAKLALGDLVYKGDSQKWIKFTYGLMARNLNHLSRKPDRYQPDLIIEYCDKSLASNADNFNIPFNGSNTLDANFYGPLRNNLTNYRQSQFILNLLNGASFGDTIPDPRLRRMLTVSADGNYRGVLPFRGDPNSTSTNTNTRTRIPNLFGDSVVNNPVNGGRFLFTDKAPLPIMTRAEILFIKAEAAFRKGDQAVAYQAYKDGITAHMDLVSSLSTTAITANERNAYSARPSVAQSAATLTLSDIMMQKYIALWGHGFGETWTDMRRIGNNGIFTGYDPTIYKGFALPTTLFTDNNGKPAYRVRPRYNSEFVWNQKAYYEVGGDKPYYHTIEPWFLEPLAQ